MSKKKKGQSPTRIPKTVSTCQECFQDYEHGNYSDGFCSDTCLEQYEKELMGENEEDDTEEEE